MEISYSKQAFTMIELYSARCRGQHSTTQVKGIKKRQSAGRVDKTRWRGTARKFFWALVYGQDPQANNSTLTSRYSRAFAAPLDRTHGCIHRFLLREWHRCSSNVCPVHSRTDKAEGRQKKTVLLLRQTRQAWHSSGCPRYRGAPCLRYKYRCPKKKKGWLGASVCRRTCIRFLQLL